MRTILVVDDEPDILFLARTVLSLAGYRVVEAESGTQALEVMASTDPDAVLLDIRLPDMDGWAVLDRMRETSWLSRSPVIVISAHTSAGTFERAEGSGASGYIAKPFAPAALTAKLDEVLL